ncbi:MAG TPA: dockerin type I domain-containing protein, partial [Chthoniobacterales bacterium]
DGTKVSLNWRAPDNGGATITQYRVYRAATANGPFVDPPLAIVTQPNYVDTAPPPGNNFYVVTAVNALGEGPFCKAFAPPTGPTESACVLPGILVSSDVLPGGADNDTGANIPPDPRVNVKFLHIGEPFVGGADQFFFTLQVAPSTEGSAPPNSQYFIIWQRQTPDTSHDRAYVAMKTGPLGETTFEYGKFGVPTAVGPNDPNTNQPTKIGDADAGSSYNPLTGAIRIVLSKDKLRAFDGGATKYQPGSDLAATNPRVFFNRVDAGPRIQSTSSDFSGEGTYQIVGNASCAPAATLLNAFSRKTHGSDRGNFDLRLTPGAQGGAVVVEPRRGGITSGDHTVVMTFPAAVTFTGASITGTGTVAGTVPAANSAPTTEVIINLTNVANQQQITVNLNGVTSGGALSTISVPMRILIGDSNGDGTVNSGDSQRTRSRSGELVNNDNFYDDPNLDGTVNSGDAQIVRRQSGTGFAP